MAEIESLSERGSSNETTNTTSINENCSKKRKTMKSGSIVWEHFENFTDSYGETGAKCKYCDKCYAAHTIDNGASTLIGHMIKCAKFPHNYETRQTQLGFQLISGGPIVEGNLYPCEFDQELCSRALTRMIIVDEQPFSVVETEGFKNFIKVLQPQFHIPSRITVIRDCFDLYREEKQKLKKIFEETRQRVSLTADT